MEASCTLFLVVLVGSMAYSSAVRIPINWADLGVTAASTSIESGATMMTAEANYRVVCTIEVENWTKYNLVNPHATIKKGELQSSPVFIRPTLREKFTAHKSYWGFSGTYGVASWRIDDGEGRRAVVMWSCPYNFWWHSNYLGVGLAEPATERHRDWFHQMYNEGNGNGLRFVRSRYDKHTPTIRTNDGKFEITGIMGTAHRTKARVIVRPVFEDDLAPNISDALRKRNLIS
ncbi:tereporin-Ca1-like [Mytilus edulis]|uniref:tereporin-Ca1-like n=1 Tax=Mytilus edulis TaxID=6550 RepID=UPI0039EE05FF